MTAAGRQNLDRMRFHLAEVDRCQKVADKLEAEWRARVTADQARLGPRGKTVDYAVVRELAGDFWYQQACASRNGHTTAAQTWALAVLAEQAAAS